MPDINATATLFAPPAYWRLPDSERTRFNGCGPGGVLSPLVPETLYGLRVTAACNIHDYMYLVGEKEEERETADRVLLNNLVRIVRTRTGNWLLLRLRLRRAWVYYWAVRRFGGPFFWSGKNLPGEEMEVAV